MEQFAVPDGKHWVDMTEDGTIVVIDQPEGQSCAAIGGIMANRMKTNGVEGCVVGGRIRDLAELKASGLPVSFDLFSSTMATSVNFSILTSGQVFAMGRSTVGTGAEAKVLARNCPIKVQNVEINPVCPLRSSRLSPNSLFIHPPIYPSPLESQLTHPKTPGRHHLLRPPRRHRRPSSQPPRRRPRPNAHPRPSRRQSQRRRPQWLHCI